MIDIDTMPAGVEMNMLIGQDVLEIVWDESCCRVCGWPLMSGCQSGNCSQRPAPKHRADAPAHYSTDIAAAWAVVEAVERRGLWIEVGLCNGEHGPQKRAWCNVGEYGLLGAYVAEVYADTAPLAICRAAYKATQSQEAP